MLEPLAIETVTDAAVLRAVERAIGELRRGEPVLLHQADGAAALILAAEQASEAGLARLGALAGGAALLVLTARRASALGIGSRIGPGDGPPAAGGVVALEIEDLPARAIVELADPTGDPRGPIEAQPSAAAPGDLAAAAVDLAKLARLLPAAVLVPRDLAGETPRAWAAAHDVVALCAADIGEYRFAGAGALARVAEARLPLAGAENARVLAFRPGDGGLEHLALVIGAPKHDESILVRLLTNNPHEEAALARYGITVEERGPHAFPSNGHNDFYLATKAARFGHRF